MPQETNNDQEQELNPFEFRVAASDTKGHSSRQYFRCMPSMARLVEQTVQGGRYPYRTKGDLLRHALHRHIKWLEEVRGVPSVTREVDAILDIMRDEEFHCDFVAVFDKMGERISSHISSGCSGEARRLLLQVLRHVEEMPDGHWRDKYKRELESKYGHIIADAPKAGLRVISGEGE